MKSRESQNGNVFDQIKNRQVEAPIDIMNASIAQTKSLLFKKRMYRWLVWGASLTVVLYCLVGSNESGTVESATSAVVQKANITPTNSEIAPDSHVESDPHQIDQGKKSSNAPVHPNHQVRQESLLEVEPILAAPMEKQNAQEQVNESVPPVTQVSEEKKEETQPVETSKKQDRSGQKKLKLKIPKP
jgi:hypothetical protein